MDYENRQRYQRRYRLRFRRRVDEDMSRPEYSWPGMDRWVSNEEMEIAKRNKDQVIDMFKAVRRNFNAVHKCYRRAQLVTALENGYSVTVEDYEKYIGGTPEHLEGD